MVPFPNDQAALRVWSMKCSEHGVQWPPLSDHAGQLLASHDLHYQSINDCAANRSIDFLSLSRASQCQGMWQIHVDATKKPTFISKGLAGIHVEICTCKKFPVYGML